MTRPSAITESIYLFLADWKRKFEGHAISRKRSPFAGYGLKRAGVPIEGAWIEVFCTFEGLKIIFGSIFSLREKFESWFDFKAFGGFRNNSPGLFKFMYHKVFTTEAVLKKTFKGKIYTEEWRNVVGYECYYEVSSFGRVKSKRDGRVMKQYVNEKGYLTIGLHSDTERKKFKTHRLVAIAFHPNPENKPEVNHDDFDKTNNFYLNLLWSTQKENTNHAQRGGRRPVAAPKPAKLGRIIYGVKVLDTSTGIVHESVFHLSQLVGVPEKELRRRLNGERMNNTPYRYLPERSKYIMEEYEMCMTRYLELRERFFGKTA
jgi:hypothetical protein